MKRAINIIGIALVVVLTVQMGGKGVWGFKAVWEQSDFVEVTELTLMPEEIINYTAIRLLKNAHDPNNFNVRIGDKLKDFYLIPVYDENDNVVRYWALGYIGEGEMKSVDEIFKSLWYPYELWLEREAHFEKLEKNLENFRNNQISKEEYKIISNELSDEYRDLSETIASYQFINPEDYVYASVGAYYETPPVVTSAEDGILYFIEDYWTCYHHVKYKYNTEDIEFIKFIFDNEYHVNCIFNVNGDYVYVKGGFSGIPDSKVTTKDEFLGFDIYDLPNDCPFFRSEEDRKELWGEEVIEYIDSLEQYGMIEEDIKF